MKRYTVERSYLVRKVQTYAFDTTEDLAAWLDEDFADADQLICDEGTLIGETIDLLDNDQLETHIVETLDVEA